MPVLQEVQDAYNAALSNMNTINDITGTLASANPFDAKAYQAATAAYAAAQTVSSTALKIIQSAAGNPAALASLLTHLNTQNSAMAQQAKSLDVTAETLENFATVANGVLTVLSAILKFV